MIMIKCGLLLVNTAINDQIGLQNFNISALLLTDDNTLTKGEIYKYWYMIRICIYLYIPVAQTLIEDTDIRVQWEKHFPIIEVVEQFPTYRVLYWYVRCSVALLISYIIIIIIIIILLQFLEKKFVGLNCSKGLLKPGSHMCLRHDWDTCLFHSTLLSETCSQALTGIECLLCAG